MYDSARFDSGNIVDPAGKVLGVGSFQDRFIRTGPAGSGLRDLMHIAAEIKHIEASFMIASFFAFLAEPMSII